MYTPEICTSVEKCIRKQPINFYIEAVPSALKCYDQFINITESYLYLSCYTLTLNFAERRGSAKRAQISVSLFDRESDCEFVKIRKAKEPIDSNISDIL